MSGRSTALQGGSAGKGTSRAFITAIMLASVAWPASASTSETRRVYCYATAQRSGDKLIRELLKHCQIYLTAVFSSDASEYLLAAMFSQALPDAGEATCVTNEYQPDLEADRQNLIDGAKVDSCTVTMAPPPSVSTPLPEQRP